MDKFVRIFAALLLALVPAAQAQEPGHYGFKSTVPSDQLNKDFGGKVDVNGGRLSNPRISLSDGVTPHVVFGTGGDASYSPRGFVVPFGGVHARSAMMGCQDQAVAFSAIADSAMSGVNSGSGFHSGFNGGCQRGVAALTNYGSFDGGAVFEQASVSYPGITLSGVTYDATHAYLATPMTAAQIQTLSINTYVPTNSVGPHGGVIGSYLAAWTPTILTTIGWYELGYAPGPFTPTAPYQTGTPSSNTVYPGMPTNTFTRNEVCNKESGTPLFVRSQCAEIDVVNNTGRDDDTLSGYNILHRGANGGGTGLTIGGDAGYANAFSTDLALINFKNSGLTIEQAPGLGGVGQIITMDAGLPLVIRNHANVTALSVDATGNTVQHGFRRVDSAAPAPAGLSKGVFVRTQSQNVMAVIAPSTNIPLSMATLLTFDGRQDAVAGDNAFALPGGLNAASHRMEAHVTASAVDGSGNTQAMSGVIKWTLKQPTGGPSAGIVASGPAIVTVEQEDAYFSTPNCGFSAQIVSGMQSVVPIFFCTGGSLPGQVTLGGSIELLSVFPN